MQRNQLIILAVGLFLLLFIVLPLINKKKTTGYDQTTRGQRTFSALDRIDADEVAYAAAHGGVFSRELADLTSTDPKLPDYLSTTPVSILELSGSKAGYIVQVASDTFQLTNVRKAGAKKPTLYCIEVKSTDKVDCPLGSITNTGTVTATT